jgi:putative spermidine/putrescine transport system substrate-binding protein
MAGIVLGALTIGSLASAHAEDKAIALMSFGGAYQEAQRHSMFEPYAKATGVTFAEQEYGGEIAKIKAMVEAGNVTLNLVDVDAPTLRQGCDEGILEKLDWSRIGPQSEWIPGSFSECGVGTIVYGTVLAYDGDKLKTGPTTIADLFDLQKFPGKRGLWKNPVGNLEFALMADGVPAGEIYKVLSTPEGVDRAFKKLDIIKPQVVWWEAGAQAPQLLASGEVVMTTAWNGRIANAIKEGKNFKMVWQSVLLDGDYWAIPKGAKNQDLTYDFIKFSVSPEHLADFTNYIPYGPVRKTAFDKVKPEVAAQLPTAPQNMGNALTISQDFWGDNGEELRKRFNTWLAAK